jgi:hypothetical protein
VIFVDWQTKGMSLLALGLIANADGGGIFSPIVQCGALGLLAVLLWMNFKTANADRAARDEAGRREAEVQTRHEDARTERDRIRTEGMRAMHAETIAALERQRQAASEALDRQRADFLARKE